MDRAVVYTQTEKLSAVRGKLMEAEEPIKKVPRLEDMQWEFNAPFETIPWYLLKQLRGREFTEDDYQRWAYYYNQMPNIWNLALREGNDIYGFVYGHWNPLESELEVKRITVHPDLFTIDGGFMDMFDIEIRKVAEKMGVKHIYCVTAFWRSFLKKMPTKLKESRVKILEVI
jgi:hypothetical protein